MPGGWIYVADFGIRQMIMAAGTIAASVGVGQDTLNAESGLPKYIEKQKKLIGSHLKEAQFAGPQATAFRARMRLTCFLFATMWHQPEACCMPRPMCDWAFGWALLP